MLLSPVSSIQKSDVQASSVISSEKLKRLYTDMVQLRALEARRNKPTLLFSEACEAAAVAELQPGDMIATLSGQRVGLFKRRTSNSAPQDSESSTTACRVLDDGGSDRLAIATGVAFANRTQRMSNVVVAFAKFGDIARGSDSVRFAQDRNLAIIYFELASPGTRKSKPTLHHLPTIPVDDSDVVAVYRVAYESIEKARRGAGPTLIQCIRHRSLSARNRAKDERADPVVYMEQYLRKRNLWSNELRS